MQKKTFKKNIHIPTVPAQKLLSGCIIPINAKSKRLKSPRCTKITRGSMGVTSAAPWFMASGDKHIGWEQRTSPCQIVAKMVRIHIIVVREIWQGPSVPQRHWDCWHQPKGSHRQTNWASFLSARIGFNMHMMDDYVGILYIIMLPYTTLWWSHSNVYKFNFTNSMPLKPFSCSQQGLKFLALSIGSFSPYQKSTERSAG